ncbi:MAG: DinB family protein [Dehalococcoidia bacterium]
MTVPPLLERLAATPKQLAHLVAEATEEQLDSSSPGEWSARTIVAHYRDCEALCEGLRIMRMLAEDKPVLTDFDELAWADARNRTRDRKEQLLGDFALQRQATLNVLSGLRPEDWEREGTHPSRGTFTVRTWVEAIADHDAAHLAQLEATLGETLDDVLQRRFHPKEA